MSAISNIEKNQNLKETENQGPITITTKELLQIIDLSAESSRKERIEKDPLFLDDKEMVELTGRKTKAKQIDALKTMLVPFRINGLGWPVVTRAAVIGSAAESKKDTPRAWAPRAITG